MYHMVVKMASIRLLSWSPTICRMSSLFKRRNLFVSFCWHFTNLIYFIASYFDEISKDTGKYCFGIQDTISALEQGAVEKLIIWEHLDVKRYVFRNPTTEAEELKYLRPDQVWKFSKWQKNKTSKIKERDRSHHMQDGVELEVQDCTEFIEWLVETDERFVDLE